MGISSDDVHTNLARRIASENRAVLHEDDVRSITGSRNGRNRAGHAASDRDKIHRETIGFQVLRCVFCVHDLLWDW
jgi:hypothetical protein